MNTLEKLKKILAVQTAALESVADSLDQSAVEAIDVLHACTGKVVVIGMGKCGHIGQKIAATFASTGTPATFLHPAEAIHGDLGYVTENDVALVLSNSGQTQEIVALLPYLERRAIKIVALTGNLDSTLGRQSHVAVHTHVDEEGDPLNLVPMASTTAMLALGDALAAVLMEKRGFNEEDYAQRHPGGSLGQKLLCVVNELMHSGDELPVARDTVTVRDAILEMTSKRLGTVFLIDDSGKLSGILTDGDIRRLMQDDPQPLDRIASEVMTRNPKRILQDTLAIDALREMERSSRVTILPVLDPEGRPTGALHVHDLIQAGIA